MSKSLTRTSSEIQPDGFNLLEKMREVTDKNKVEIEPIGEEIRGTSLPETLNADEILGALGKMARSQAFQQALARRIAASAPIIRKVINKTRDYQIAIGPGDIPPGGVTTFTIQPMSLFRGEKLICIGDPQLYIDAIFVGNQLQFNREAYPMSVELLAPNALGSGFNMDACQVGLLISFVVRNESKKKQRFYGTLFGRALFS